MSKIKSLLDNIGTGIAMAAMTTGTGLLIDAQMKSGDAQNTAHDSRDKISQVINMNEPLIKAIERKLAFDKTNIVDLVNKTVEHMENEEEFKTKANTVKRMTTDEIQTFLYDKLLTPQEIDFCTSLYKQIDEKEAIDELLKLKEIGHLKEAGAGWAFMLLCSLYCGIRYRERKSLV